MDQYFESSSNSDGSDDDRVSPGIEYTPPSSPGPVRAHPEAIHNNASNPTSPSHAPPLPNWGSAKDLLDKNKDVPANIHSTPASANNSFTLPSTSMTSLPTVSSASSVPSTANAANAAAIAAAIDSMRPTSPPITKLASSTDLGNAAGIVLINGSKWRGRKLEDCLSREGVPFPSRFRVVCTKRSLDVQTMILNIFARQQQLVRVAIAGSDSYINEVLRPFVEQLGKKPRGWDSLHFYILPIGKNNNDVAAQVAQHDFTYKSLFFTPTWQHVFAQRDTCTDDECREVQQRILQYLDEESTVGVRFPIGEALITYPDSAGKSVPFLKGVHIADPVFAAPQTQAQAPDDEHDGNLQLDYWVPKKKGGSEDHLEFKGTFQFAAVTRLASVASALRLALPNSSTLSLLVQPRDRKGRKNVLSRHFATKLGKGKGKDEKDKGKDEKDKGKDKKKKDEKDPLNALVTKLVCSVANDTANGVFRAVIDGVEHPGVKFVSLSPQWANHVKTFTVQAFACDTEGSGISTPPTSSNPLNVGLGAGSGASSAQMLSSSAPASSSSLIGGPVSTVQGSGTPNSSVRGSPIMNTAQGFPPLNLNAVKSQGSPLLTKHNAGGTSIPSGMSSATDV